MWRRHINVALSSHTRKPPLIHNSNNKKKNSLTTEKKETPNKWVAFRSTTSLLKDGSRDRRRGGGGVIVSVRLKRRPVVLLRKSSAGQKTFTTVSWWRGSALTSTPGNREETFSINEVVAFKASSARVKVDNLKVPYLCQSSLQQCFQTKVCFSGLSVNFGKWQKSIWYCPA